MRTELPYRGPYDWATARRLIGAHAVAGAERVEPDGSVTRLITVGGSTVAVTVRDLGGAIGVDHPDDVDREALDSRVRHWLDLDLNPAAVHDHFRADPRFADLVTANPGLRKIGYPQGFEAVVLTVLGQQVSLAAGRTFAGRMVAAYGTAGPSDLSVFPTPERLAELDHDQLQQTVGLTHARTRTVQTVARAFADDPELAVPGPQSAAERDAAAARLLRLPGIGPWTVDYLRMRLFGDPDALPAGDLVLRKALDGLPAREVTSLAEHWRPWRSYAVLLLWSTMAWA